MTRASFTLHLNPWTTCVYLNTVDRHRITRLVDDAKITLLSTYITMHNTSNERDLLIHINMIIKQHFKNGMLKSNFSIVHSSTNNVLGNITTIINFVHMLITFMSRELCLKFLI